MDQWNVPWLKAMSLEAKEGLAAILNMVEGCRAWPTHTMSNTIVLMGKPQGGCRPIALMPMLYRLWTKVRKPQIQQWDKTTCRGPWDAAIQGSSALRAAILTMFQDELHLLNGGEVASILWDMEKFYDSLDIGRLVDKAREMGYPTLIFGLGILMHMSPRVIKAYDHYGLPIMPSNGIIAGCTQSTFWARLFLYKIMEQAYTQEMGKHLRTFIDDVSQRVHSRNVQELENKMVEMATNLGALSLIHI